LGEESALSVGKHVAAESKETKLVEDTKLGMGMKEASSLCTASFQPKGLLTDVLKVMFTRLT
jgi:hypothetical protein